VFLPLEMSSVPASAKLAITTSVLALGHLAFNWCQALHGASTDCRCSARRACSSVRKTSRSSASRSCVDKVDGNDTAPTIVNMPDGICDTVGSFTLTVQ